MLSKILFVSFLISIIALFNTGCSSNELIKYADDNSCLTTIEGNYYKELTAKCNYPAIFLRMEKYPKLVEGEMIEIDSTGVLFDPKDVGFSNIEETFFPYDTLYGVIDTNGKLIYGSVPDFYAVNQKVQIELEKTDSKKVSELILMPNEPFAYCIEPGNYKVSQINFPFVEKDVQDLGYDLPDITLTIEQGKVNYLGNIYADYKTSNDENVLIIPCDRHDEQASSAAGFFGGLIGAVAYTIASEIADAGLHHVIHIERDKNFLPEAPKPVSEINLDIKPVED